MNLEINHAETEWIKKELEIMIEEVDNGNYPRTQFSKNIMVSLLAKLRELED